MLIKIRAAAEQVKTRMLAVSDKTRQQTGAVEQISQSSQSLEQSSEQTAKEAEDTTATSNEMLRQAKERELTRT
jgi:methyl-accepting chemotaxis protein